MDWQMAYTIIFVFNWGQYTTGSVRYESQLYKTFIGATSCLLAIVYNVNVISTLTVLVTTIDAQWEGMGDVGSVRYEPALLPTCPTIRVLSYSN